jgi:hypothetical protein
MNKNIKTPLVSSLDNKLQIINFVAFRDPFGCYLVEGTLKNASSDSEIDAKIKIDYFDTLDILVDNEIDTIKSPQPGATRGFYIVYSGRRRGDIQSHKISLYTSKSR